MTTINMAIPASKLEAARPPPIPERHVDKRGGCVRFQIARVKQNDAYSIIARHQDVPRLRSALSVRRRGSVGHHGEALQCCGPPAGIDLIESLAEFLG